MAWSPAGVKGREVGQLGVRWWRGFAVVAVPGATVLVGDGAPAPVGRRPVRGDADGVQGVDAFGVEGAQVGPVVAESKT